MTSIATQNRERVFIVSIRKDVDDGKFEFPKPYDSGLRLKDLLEVEVEDKYYIDNDRTNILLNNLKDKEMLLGGINVSKQGKVFDGSTEVASCLLARDYKGLGNQSMTAVAEPTIVASSGRNPNNPSDRTVGSPTEQRLEPNSQGIANTLTTVQKDNLVLEKVASCNQAVIELVDLEKYYLPENSKDYNNYDKSKVDKYICPINPIQIGNSANFGNAVSNSDVLYTIRASQPNGTLKEDYRIRKLTPKECWRLMGFTDGDYFKARQALEDRFYNGKDRSNSQMYKMAGNSIVVDVLEGIFKQMF